MSSEGREAGPEWGQLSRELMRRTYELAGVGSYTIDRGAAIISMSPELAHLLGIGDEAIDMPLAEFRERFAHPDDRAPAVATADAAYDAGRLLQLECRMIRADGRVIWVRASSATRHTPDGRALVAGVMMDITESRVTLLELGEQARYLARSTDLLSQFIKHTPAAVAMLDRNMRYMQASDRWLTDYRLQGQDLIGRSHYDVFPDAPERWKEIHRRVLAGAVERCDEDAFPRADGTVEWLQWEVRPWHGPDGEIGGIVIYTQVITERKRAEEELRLVEEQLRQAQKMEAIGVLAGGVAHDFNNLLSVILGYSELMMAELPADTPLLEDLRQIREAGDRAVKMTRQLLTFSRQEVVRPVTVDFNELVAGTTKMLRRLIGTDIELATTLCASPVNVFVDPVQMEQVLMNLAVNARDAMPAGGTLGIELRRGELGGAEALRLALSPGPYVTLSVSDTGTGMDAATRARIFEPFFTTKPVGKGTGLGLSTVFGIVKQAGGSIEVESEPGHGATFRIRLPQTINAGEPVTPPTGDFAPAAVETILLVEDDDAVRKLTRMILTRRGYRVLEARSGGDALVICETHAGAIDLVLTDMVMPLVSGDELVRRLRVMRPGLRAVIMSGHPEKGEVRRGDVDPEYFVQKPFTPQMLLDTIRAALGT